MEDLAWRRSGCATPMSIGRFRHLVDGAAALDCSVRLALSKEHARGGSTLGPNGQVHVWTYSFVGRPVTLLVTKSWSGPLGHRVEPDPLHR
jgi:hypothetical protein